MAFCTNCGQQVDDGVKFCANCGTPTMQNASANDEKRKTVYDGKIHKCPGCNEILKSFEINCPYCGYELRDVKTSSAVKEFVLKLENIGLVGEKSKKSFDVNERYTQITEVSEIADKKINLIRNFNVPNSKEDMLEFMILASSNIKISVYDSFDSDFQSKDAKEINEAWISKVQQVYDKARVSCFADETFNEIERIYNGVNEKIIKAKKSNHIKIALIIAGVLGAWIILFVLKAINLI